MYFNSDFKANLIYHDLKDNNMSSTKLKHILKSVRNLKMKATYSEKKHEKKRKLVNFESKANIGDAETVFRTVESKAKQMSQSKLIKIADTETVEDYKRPERKKKFNPNFLAVYTSNNSPNITKNSLFSNSKPKLEKRKRVVSFDCHTEEKPIKIKKFLRKNTKSIEKLPKEVQIKSRQRIDLVCNLIDEISINGYSNLSFEVDKPVEERIKKQNIKRIARVRHILKKTFDYARDVLGENDVQKLKSELLETKYENITNKKILLRTELTTKRFSRRTLEKFNARTGTYFGYPV